MEHRVPMGVRRRDIGFVAATAAIILLGTAASGSDVAAYHSVGQAASQGSSSSSQKARKPVHHATAPQEDAASAELKKAEELIQKQDFAQAEPLLQKLAEDDPSNFVVWFDLGFVENGLKHVDES